MHRGSHHPIRPFWGRGGGNRAAFRWKWKPAGQANVIEMAAASGLESFGGSGSRLDRQTSSKWQQLLGWNLSVEVEAGWTGKPPLNNVTIDAVWQECQLPVLKGLGEKRATLLKTHLERPSGVYVNKTQTMFGPSSDFHSVPSARMANKVLRECLYHAFPVVNSHVFPAKTVAEAKAIAQLATQGLATMKQQGQLGDYRVQAVFAGDGVDLTIHAVDSNRITLVNETVTLTQPE